MVGCARALSRMRSRRAVGVFKEAGACALTRAVRDRINRLDYLVLYMYDQYSTKVPGLRFDTTKVTRRGRRGVRL